MNFDFLDISKQTPLTAYIVGLGLGATAAALIVWQIRTPAPLPTQQRMYVPTPCRACLDRIAREKLGEIVETENNAN